MRILISIVIAFIIVRLFEKNIRKHAAFWYIGAILLGVFSLFLPSNTPTFLKNLVTNYISRGTFATALIILVMYARVFPKKSSLFRLCMGLRAQMAIIASFLIFVHNSYMLRRYILLAAKGMYSPSIYERVAMTCSCFMILLLIPLCITSFTTVRKKMQPRKWKKLQRTSYVFYGLIYVHVASLFLLQISNGQRGYLFELMIYTAIFAGYLVSRVLVYCKERNSKSYRKQYNFVYGILVIFLCVLVYGISLMIYRNAQDAQADTDMIQEEQENTQMSEETQSFEAQYEDGVYPGEGMGYNDVIKVEVTILQGEISAITLLQSGDDAPYFTNAKDALFPAIIEAQDTQVDSVTGATFSSKGIKAAVEDALSKATEK